MEPPATPPTGDPRPGAGEWLAAAAAVLRKARRLPADAPDEDVWDALARHTAEDVVIPPLGTPATAAGIDPGPVGAAPFTRGMARGGWDVRALLADPDAERAATDALADLDGGATSLWLRVGPGGTALTDLARVLRHVHLDIAPVVLEATGQVTDIELAQAFSAALDGRAPAAGTSLGTDPIGWALRTHGQATPHRPDLHEASRASRWAIRRGIGAIVVDGTAAHDAGAADALELGYTLAVAVEYLRALEQAGVAAADAAGPIAFRYAVTDEQFPSIAKLRAARHVWSRVLELCGLTPVCQVQHAVTSAAMLTRYDPYTNLLRTTVAAFAAGAGGADAITVLPFDSALGVPDSAGRRLARNIPALLTGESHIGTVADPAGGAHAVEVLTAGIAEAAWAEFGRIEAAGGILAALADGSLHSRIRQTADRRAAAIARREHAITGTSEFPLAGEIPPARCPAPSISGLTRWAEPFEALRDHPAHAPVFLTGIGPLAAHTARAGFARNLLTAGGIDVVNGPVDAAPDVVAGAFAGSGTTVALLAGSDHDYGVGGARVAQALRDAGASRIIVAGRNPGGLADLTDLTELADDWVAGGDDVLDFLSRTRSALGVTAR